MVLKRNSHIPLYKQAKAYLLEYIGADGEVSRKLPTEAELSGSMGISTGTVRIAVRELVQEGKLERVPGKGTFIRKRSRSLRFANWYGTEAYTKGPTERSITDFAAANPGISIENIPVPFEKIEHQLMLMTAAGKAPDIASLVYLWIPAFAAQGTIIPLEDLPLQIDSEDTYPQSEKSVIFNGRHYGRTWANGPTILFGNGPLVEEYAGSANPDLSTLDSFKDVCTEIYHRSNGKVIPFSIPITDDELFFLYSIYSFLVSFGGGIVDEEGEVNFDWRANIRAYQWLRDFIREARINTENDFRRARILFSQSKIAFSIEAPWLKGIIPSLNPGYDIRDLRYYLIPEGPRGYSASVLYNVVLSVFTQCADKEAAAEFLRFLTDSPETARRYYRESGMLPNSRRLTEADPVYHDPFGSLLRQQMKTAGPVPSNHPSFLLSVIFCAKASREILLSGGDPAPILRDTAGILKELYKR